jgi:hypothetical protein
MNDSDIQPPVYKGEDVRQGEIILRTHTRRNIFLAGLAGAIFLGCIWLIMVHASHHIVS